MLQRLLKYEVKAWLYQKIILLPLWFYVKSNFGEFKQSKNVILGNLRDSELWIFRKFGTWKMAQIYQIQDLEPPKLPIMTFFDRLNSPKFDFI